MQNADIAELLAVAYTSYCFECENASKTPVAPGEFFEKYKYHIQDFRSLLFVSSDDRTING